MLRLGALIEGIPGAKLTGDGERAVREVRDDSRLVEPGDLFVALPGTKLDGRRFIQDALTRGAAAIVSEDDGSSPAPGVTWIQVGDARRALGVLAANRYQAA